MSRIRYIGAYLVFESYPQSEIPVISVTVTAVTNASAVARVHMHPNPHLHKLTRGINVYVVCRTAELGIDVEPKNNVILVGDVASVQVSTSGSSKEYIVNLVDSRRYLAELPTFYLKLLREQYAEQDNVRNKEGTWIFSFADQIADANFYGVAGEYMEDTFYYDIADALNIWTYMQAHLVYDLWTYILEMQLPLYEDKGWEPYYINMNKKKLITDGCVVFDDGMYHADLAASVMEEAVYWEGKNNQCVNPISHTGTYALWHSTIQAHKGIRSTYNEVLQRLTELGYAFNTLLFPSTRGLRDDIGSFDGCLTERQVIDRIKSRRFSTQLLQVVSVDDGDENAIRPRSGEGVGLRMIDVKGVPMILKPKSGSRVLSGSKDGKTYYAILAPTTKNHRTGASNDDRIYQFFVTPKFYGVMPPHCNLAIMKDGVNFNCSIAEPPITALKYNLTEGNSGASVYCCAVPEVDVLGKANDKRRALQIYSYQMSRQPAQGTVDVVIAEGGISTPLANARLTLMPGTEWGSTAEKHTQRGSSATKNGGTDFPTENRKDGVACLAWAPGKVVRSDSGYANGKNQNHGWGNLVVIETYGEDKRPYWWYYAHLASVSVPVGAKVEPGQVIGIIGNTGSSTGNHLHFSINIPSGSKGNYTHSTNWVHTSRLIEGYAGGTWENQPGSIVDIDLPKITDTIFSPSGEAVSDTGVAVQEVLPSNPPEWRLLYPKGHHFPDEDIYGIKRISKTGPALYELQKASQYAGEPSGDDPSITAEEKFALLRAKALQDYHETRVSRNTGRITFEGLNEYVVVGLPFMIYDPGVQIFYYGFVEEVSHKIDNSAGQAYTEVALSSVTTARSIMEIERKFAGYNRKRNTAAGNGEDVGMTYSDNADYVGELATLYMFYGCHRLTREEYNLCDLDKLGDPPERDRQAKAPLYGFKSREAQLVALMTGPHRELCTIEQLQTMYHPKKEAVRHNKVADKICPNIGWVTDNMKQTIDDIIDYYNARLQTQMFTINKTRGRGLIDPVEGEWDKIALGKRANELDSIMGDDTGEQE